MKKTFIFIAILFILASATTAFAVTVNQKILNKKMLTDDKVQTITSSVMDVRTVEVIKFVDGNVTCYVSYSSKYPDNTEQISCVK